MTPEHNLSRGADSQVDAPSVGGLPLGPGLGVALYVLLVASAGLAFFGRSFPGRLPIALERVTPWVFAVFVACFAVYRFGLASAPQVPGKQGFFPGRAGGGGLPAAAALVPGALSSRPGRRSARRWWILTRGLRALAAEVARLPARGTGVCSALVQALSDPDPTVRAQAHASLVRLDGEDLGSPDAPGAVEAWRQRYP